LNLRDLHVEPGVDVEEREILADRCRWDPVADPRRRGDELRVDVAALRRRPVCRRESSAAAVGGSGDLHVEPGHDVEERKGLADRCRRDAADPRRRGDDHRVDVAALGESSAKAARFLPGVTGSSKVLGEASARQSRVAGPRARSGPPAARAGRCTGGRRRRFGMSSNEKATTDVPPPG
jgi:hypothetical protein